jgi:hypothetical protein
MNQIKKSKINRDDNKKIIRLIDALFKDPLSKNFQKPVNTKS